MTPTPTQIAEWRKEFESVCLGALEIVKLANGTYADSRTEAVWQWHKQTKTAQATEIAELKAKLAELLRVLKEGRRAIGDHYAPDHCYATGPMSGNDHRDLVECPACSFIAMYENTVTKLLKEEA